MPNEEPSHINHAWELWVDVGDIYEILDNSISGIMDGKHHEYSLKPGDKIIIKSLTWQGHDNIRTISLWGTDYPLNSLFFTSEAMRLLDRPGPA